MSFSKSMKAASRVFFFVGFILLNLGCNSDDPVPPLPPADFPANTTPDILMSNFGTIYCEMRIDDFRNMLHTDFKMVLLPSTLQEWEQGGNPLDSEVFDRADEVRIHENIFRGNTGLDPDGVIIPPIDSIQVEHIQKVGTWEPIPDSDTHFGGFGGYWALFNVLISFNNPDQHSFEVRQEVEFYVVPLDDNGVTIFKLLGQRGLEPVLKATDSVKFDSVKALYR